MTQPAELRFGPFVLHLALRRLTRDGAPIALSALPFGILAILVASDERVVTRDELKAALWPHATRIDTDRRLNTAMRALREALQDSAETPRFIETVRGTGYRWIGAAPPPVARPRAVAWPAAAAAVIAAVVLSSISLGSVQTAPSPADRERLVAIAAQAPTAPDEAAAALDALIIERPSYAAAQVMRARMAVDQWRSHPNAEGLSIARTAVARARDAVGSTPDILTLHADLLLAGDWNWTGAERDYRRALAAEPAHVGARKGLAWLLLNAGRENEALALLEPGFALATDDVGERAELGWLLLRMRRPDLALAMCGATGAEHINLLSCQHTALARLGRMEEARGAGLALMRVVGADTAARASVQGPAPDAGYARFLHWRTHAFLPENATWFQRAQVYADAGDRERSLASLERAAAAREPALIRLPTTEEFAWLRQSPRFIAVLDRLGAPAR